MPADRNTASPGPSRQSKKRGHKACLYCRTHRIKLATSKQPLRDKADARCVPVEGEDRCRKCVDHDSVCDKESAPPKDVRPRRRLLFRNLNSLSQNQNLDAVFLGSSSLALLAWKHAPQTPDMLNQLRTLDDQYELYRGTVGGLEQTGLLAGQNPRETAKAERPTLISVGMVQTRLMQDLGSETVLRSLYETCRDRIIPLFPVISVSESLLADRANEGHVNKYAPVDPNSTPGTPLPQLVRMIHCAVASRARDVPESIRKSVLTSLHSLLLGPEMAKITTTRCLGSIQVLMLLSMCDDLLTPDSTQARETQWQNVGTAVRMAFAIGLHRHISASHIQYFQQNRRLRVWGACVSIDRWIGITTGRGFSIDLADCDAPLPRHFADGIRDGHTEKRIQPVFPCFRFHSEFTSLSILMGRAYRLVGGPQGLQEAYDLSLMILQADIDSWIAGLPTSWPYSINLTLRQAPALMNLFIVALEFTFQRSLLWPTSPIPSQVTYRPSRERWLDLCRRAEQAVYWLQSPEGTFYLDTWSIASYPAYCCVIIHQKSLEESKDPHHRWLLEQSDGIIQQWAQASPDDPLRQKLAAMSTLLLNAATSEMTKASMTMQDLMWTQPNSVGSEGSATDYMEQMGLNGQGLDSMWFENI